MRPANADHTLANLCLGLGYPIVAGRESASVVRIKSVGAAQAFPKRAKATQKVLGVHAPTWAVSRQKIRQRCGGGAVENCLHKIEATEAVGNRCSCSLNE